jgi:hypothetical protein
MRTTRTASALRVAAAAALAASLAPAGLSAAEAGMSLPEVAAPSAKVRDTRFRFLDLDDDGYIARDEVPADDAVLRSQFSALDRDDDGRLSPEEYIGPGR